MIKGTGCSLPRRASQSCILRHWAGQQSRQRLPAAVSRYMGQAVGCSVISSPNRGMGYSSYNYARDEMLGPGLRQSVMGPCLHVLFGLPVVRKTSRGGTDKRLNTGTTVKKTST